MYLSRLILDPRSRQVQNELSDFYQMHRTLLRAFPEDLSGERVLFRVDVDRATGIPRVIVQSINEPNWAVVEEIEGYLLPEYLCGEENPACKPYNPRFYPGQRLRFRLRANPAFRKAGQRQAWLREEQQINWLARKADHAGFVLLSVTVVPEGFQKARKHEGSQSHLITYFAVRFDGILQVVDPDAFLLAMQRGIGPAKAFGCGLLSVAPASV